MKFLITESELNRFIVNYMNKMYHPDDLEIVHSEKYPESTFYKKDGEVVMEQDLKNRYFWFGYDIIWSYFIDDLGLKYQQVKEGLTIWLDETMNIRGLTPRTYRDIALILLDDTMNITYL